MASTIQVDKIQDTGGNTILSSNSTGTFTYEAASGANFTALDADNVSAGTLAIARGGTGAATFAAAGLANSPAFHAYMSANQSIANSTNTKIAFDSERFDTGGDFDTTNYKFVVPSGAGTYVFHYWAKMGLDDGKLLQLILYKNGSELLGEETRANFYSGASAQQISAVMSFVDVSSAADYYELFVFQNNGGAVNLLQESTGLMGFKLIGV